ncbi:tail fiber assembly protein [Salmonella enterica subsp. enterica serovar Lexington]|nr:tail fiber assembly protein [Salmonella enterica subsp. enterica serovar Lexington]
MPGIVCTGLKFRRHKLEPLQEANTMISTLQDAVDMEMATAEETVALAEWKKYRVLLMRVNISKPVWPIPPEDQAN